MGHTPTFVSRPFATAFCNVYDTFVQQHTATLALRSCSSTLHRWSNVRVTLSSRTPVRMRGPPRGPRRAGICAACCACVRRQSGSRVWSTAPRARTARAWYCRPYVCMLYHPLCGSLCLYVVPPPMWVTRSVCYSPPMRVHLSVWYTTPMWVPRSVRYTP